MTAQTRSTFLNTINQVLHFWFGRGNDQDAIIAHQSMLWWGKDVAVDMNVKRQFGELYQRAINNELQDWQGSARGQLALIILLDQFSRMFHRDHADAFAQDHKALLIALTGLGDNHDQSLRPVERVFYYMPLEHSEKIDIQNQSVALFHQLMLDVPMALKEKFQSFLTFAERHQMIIERFNRFPHRNKLLGRTSNTAEIAFLTMPNSSF